MSHRWRPPAFGLQHADDFPQRLHDLHLRQLGRWRLALHREEQIRDVGEAAHHVVARHRFAEPAERVGLEFLLKGALTAT